MVGPFMQAVLLLSIIYVYSRGLINLINDYYRGEFNRKLKSDINQQSVNKLKPAAYDLNDMDRLVTIERSREIFENIQVQFMENNTDNNINITLTTKNSKICYSSNRKEEFLNIIYKIISKISFLKNPICWLNDNNNTYYYTNMNVYAAKREGRG